MDIPLSWLRDYVEPTLPVPQLAERVTLAGLEVTGVRAIGLPPPEGLNVKGEGAGPVWDRDKVVVARVLGVEKHPNADRLTLVTLDYGAGQPKTVVTGAPNLKPGDQGQAVVLGLAGTEYFDGHVTPKALKKLEPRAVRGIMNDAMVMSEFELGISDEHAGIIVLGEDAPPPGTPLADFLGDVVLEADVLPNMARCLALIGVAREVAALTGQKVRLPEDTLEEAGEPIEGQVEVAIENPALSARYAALLLRGVRVGPSPGWMQRRLASAGMRPVNNVVDVTNYVMLEWGQPLHAFDYDLLRQRAGGKSPVISVRPARAGEWIRTLDRNLRELKADNLVIADVAGPVAIAGVMGGADTEVSSATTNVLLESANFDFRSVRRTMRQFDLPSEASVRFSRGVHPEVVRPAARRAAELMRRHAGATVCRGMVDAYPAPVVPQTIPLDLAEVHRILGIDFPAEEAARILRALEFRVEPAGVGRLSVTPPPFRLDIQEGPADLVEELARVYGYDRLPETLLADELPEQHANRSLELEERTRDLLADLGLQEVVTYSLTEPSREAPLGLTTGEYVQLLNPISSERVAMRHTVLAGVLETAAANLKHREDVRLFELGPVYLSRPGEKLPAEPRRLALVLTGRRRPEFWGEPGAAPPALDFFDIKGVVEGLADGLHLSAVSYRSAKVPYLHPGRAAELMIDGKPAGDFGELHPRTAEAYGLAGRTVLAAEFDLEAVLAAVPPRHAYRPVPRYPAALRDIAVIVPETVTAERVDAEIRAAGGELLRGVRLFDLYRGESIPAGTRSLAYALTYQADDRTLTDKEVDKAHRKVEDRLRHVLKAQVRGKDEAQ
jgi:phenylalanyl-tRNA synthetase beta chain